MKIIIKKFLYLILILVFILFNANLIRASNYLLFPTGDIWFLSHGATTNNVHFLNSSASYSKTDITAGSEPVAVLNDFLGNVFIVNRGDSDIDCFSPPTFTGSALCPGSPPYSISGFSPMQAIMDAQQNIWLSNVAFDGSKTTVGKLTRIGNYSSVTPYTVNSGGTYGEAVAIMLDNFGDIWVTNTIKPGLTFGTTITCLDASNSFNYCAGGPFNSLGQIDLGAEAPSSLALTSDGDILVSARGTDPSYADGGVYLLDRNNNFDQTFLVNIAGAFMVATDSNDKIFYANSEVTKLYCLNPGTYTTCSGFSGGLTVGASETTDENLVGLSVDQNDNIWLANEVDDKLYCLDSTNSYNATGTGSCPVPITLGSQLGGTLAYYYGDPTGQKLYNHYNSVAADEDVNISAAVDPNITLTLSSNLCSLGSLTSSLVYGCSFNSTVSSNATGGYTLFVKDGNNGTLNSGSDTINSVSSSPISPGDEEFGVSTSDSGNTISATTNCNTTPSSDTSAASALTNTNQDFGSGVSPVDGEITTLCVSASISDITAAGSYSDTLTITLIGYF